MLPNYTGEQLLTQTQNALLAAIDMIHSKREKNAPQLHKNNSARAYFPLPQDWPLWTQRSYPSCLPVPISAPVSQPELGR